MLNIESYRPSVGQSLPNTIGSACFIRVGSAPFLSPLSFHFTLNTYSLQIRTISIKYPCTGIFSEFFFFHRLTLYSKTLNKMDGVPDEPTDPLKKKWCTCWRLRAGGSYLSRGTGDTTDYWVRPANNSRSSSTTVRMSAPRPLVFSCLDASSIHCRGADNEVEGMVREAAWASEMSLTMFDCK